MQQLADDIAQLYLDELQSSYAEGDSFQLLAAIRFCGRHQLAMPDWVVEAFHAATDKWYSLQINTLDDALDVAWPRGKALDSARKRRREQITVYNKVSELHGAGQAMDAALFEQVGARFGLSAETAVQYYYTVKRFFDPTSVPAAIEQLLAHYCRQRATRSGSR